MGSSWTCSATGATCSTTSSAKSGPSPAWAPRTCQSVGTRTASHGATADDAAYATFELAGGVVAHINSSWCVRVNRDELFELQVDGTQGSAVAGLRDCKTQHGENTPKAVWNPDLPDTNDYRSQWLGVPQDEDADNAFKIQWEMFLRHGWPTNRSPTICSRGAKGVQLAELGLRSWKERRWLEVPELESSRTPQEELGHA